MLSLVIAGIGCLLTSVVVFGGGQIFIPFFEIIFNLMGVDQDVVDSVITIANATPGVFSTKLAFISGYLAANGEWWGYIGMLATYLIFASVPIAMMFFSMRFLQKMEKSTFFIILLKYMRPIVAGIMISLAIQLLISVMLPFINFNEFKDYASLKYETFFTEWRFWVLITFVPISIAYSYWLIYKKKINMIFIILFNIVITLIIFQPWLV